MGETYQAECENVSWQIQIYDTPPTRYADREIAAKSCISEDIFKTDQMLDDLIHEKNAVKEERM